MFRTQRIGDFVFFAEPFSKINQPTAFGTEWAEISREPIADAFAGRTFHIHKLAGC
jgi:hypothetical protein